MPTIILQRTFQAAHRLPSYDGKCGRIHGHNFHVTAEVKADLLDDQGFVIDFDRVKAFLDSFDHKLILSAKDPIQITLSGIPLEEWIVRVPGEPTTEFMADWIARGIVILVGQSNDNAFMVDVEVTLRETDSITAKARAGSRQ